MLGPTLEHGNTVYGTPEGAQLVAKKAKILLLTLRHMD